MKILCSLDMHFTNHIDHFIPLCALLDAPLATYTDEDEAIIRTYYPFESIRRIPQDERIYATLADQADVFITSTMNSGPILSGQCHIHTNKKIPNIFLPHGQSDKAYIAQEMVNHAPYRFVYGNYMEEQLMDQNVAADVLLTLGNFRKIYYETHAPFFDAFVPTHRFTREKTLLYAPTWNDHEQSSSLEVGFQLLDTLAEHYNLIIKLHPITKSMQPGYYYAVQARFENHPSVWVASDIPLIYPLLAASDIYLGDYSSIGYDFLSFDRPLFFLPPKKATKCVKGNTLHSCGRTIHPTESILEVLNETDTYHAARHARYTHAFAEQDPQLKEKIAKIVENA